MRRTPFGLLANPGKDPGRCDQEASLHATHVALASTCLKIGVDLHLFAADHPRPAPGSRCLCPTCTFVDLVRRRQHVVQSSELPCKAPLTGDAACQRQLCCTTRILPRAKPALHALLSRQRLRTRSFRQRPRATLCNAWATSADLPTSDHVLAILCAAVPSRHRVRHNSC